jgi:hypothetical protein
VAKITFKIGDAFPASEPVSRFISVLAMMSNDWLRSIEDMFALETATTPDAGARRISLFRQQAALHHEAATFIRDSMRRFPEIEQFVQGLSADAKEECDQDRVLNRTWRRLRQCPFPICG